VKISATLDDLTHHAHWPSALVHVAREGDDVLFPLARYALPTRAQASGPGVIDFELASEHLPALCRENPATRRVVCGAAP
jgi:hypothetical protein